MIFRMRCPGPSSRYVSNCGSNQCAIVAAATAPFGYGVQTLTPLAQSSKSGQAKEGAHRR